MSVFSGQLWDLIALAEDEARMLGQVTVEPEHLLLAIARDGSVASLLRQRGVTAGDLHAAILRMDGLGDGLVLGPVPRSPRSGSVLERAVEVAAERGVYGAHAEHLLLALDGDERATAVLRAVGITNIDALIDASGKERHAPLSTDQLTKHLLRTAIAATPLRALPIPPVFERFTAEAQRGIRAALEIASLLEHREVEPFHLLLGLLNVPGSLARGLLVNERHHGHTAVPTEAMESARMYGPNPSHEATGIFTGPTRRLVAEEALKLAYRQGHARIGTGHLLIAILDSEDKTTGHILDCDSVGGRHGSGRLEREVFSALPGDEHPARQGDGGWISFDVLIRTLSTQFAKIVPKGWIVRGSARSDGIRLKVPDSRSEEDFRIHMGWIVSHDASARERLLRVTLRTLEDLQKAIADHTTEPWPDTASAGPSDRPAAHADLLGDEVNPMLRLWYGEHSASVLDVFSQPILLTSFIRGL